MADKPLIGCKCYVGLMVRMGFNIVNHQPVDDNDSRSFCESNPLQDRMITGRPISGAHRKLPDVSPPAASVIAAIQPYTRLRPIGGVEEY